MKLQTQRSEREAAKAEERKLKMAAKLPQMQMWMQKAHLPNNLRRQILSVFEEKFNEEVHMETLISAHAVLPRHMRRSLEVHFCMKALSQSPTVEKNWFLKFKLSLAPFFWRPMAVVKYTENKYIMEMGKPIDRLVIVAEGMVWIDDNSSSAASRRLEDASGCVFGHELLAPLPDRHISTISVRCQTKVEGFAFTAADLDRLVGKDPSDQAAEGQDGVVVPTAISTGSTSAMPTTLEFDPYNYKGM